MTEMQNPIVHNLKRAKQLLTAPFNSGPGMSLSCKLFGNSAGFQQNVYGGLELFNARRKKTAPDDGAPTELVETIRRDGVAVAPWRYDRALMETIRTRIDAAINEGADRAFTDSKGSVVQRLVDDPLKSVPEIKELATPELMSTLHSYFRSRVRFYYPDCWRNYPITEDEPMKHSVYANRWHNDSGKTSILSLFVLVADTSPQHGPMLAVNRDLTRESIRKGFRHRYAYGEAEPMLEDPKNHIMCSGEAGTAFFVNTRVALHRAGIPANGLFRDMVSLHFASIPGDEDVWDDTKAPEGKTLEWHRF